MLPDNPDDQARLFYLAILGLVIAWSLLWGQGHRIGRSLRDMAVWVLIFAMVVIGYGFRDTLSAGLFPSATISLAADVVELRRGADGHFHADMEVNGAPIRFMVDTGASDVVLSMRDARAAGIDPAELNFAGRARTANGLVPIARVTLGDVALGDIRDVNVGASVGAGDLDVSLLGMSYLDRYGSIRIEGDSMILAR
jgi:aspartyl protease family protein